MILESILSFARSTMQKVVRPGDTVVDATIGNGHDTAFLAELVGEKGHVYGFDIQAEAVTKTKERLAERDLLDRVSLFQTGHEHVREMINLEDDGQISGAIFNLGYLPGGNKSIVTKSETTIAAIEQLIEMMARGGVMILVIYHGHKEGAKEKDDLLKFVQSLDQNDVHVLQYRFINQMNNPPFIIAIEKK